ncbi:MAG TPA: AbrB/MazE/SpoVT family DNA-binding domain-containing protein [Candidatus Thermoplasmatota archaeon]|nr:AbrB/MazE/SpoVT family DNA-binding domain-containing protein [Candidatus Thermoplasmatota archaeon]
MSPLALIVATTTRLSLCGRSDVREALGIGPGDYVAFEVVGSEAHVFKVMWTKA